MREQQSPHMEFLFLCVLSLVLFQISQIVFFGICNLFYSLKVLQENIHNPRIIFGSALVMQVFTFCLPALVIIRTARRPLTDFIGIKPWNKQWIIKTFGIFVAAYFIMLFLGQINAGLENLIPGSEAVAMEKEQDILMQKVFSSGGLVQLFFGVIIVGLVTAICEELFFRGMVLGVFLRISGGNKHFAVITSSLIFAALHLQPLKLLPMLFLGMVLGYLYTETKNLKYSILFHFLINGSQIVMLYFLGGEI